MARKTTAGTEAAIAGESVVASGGETASKFVVETWTIEALRPTMAAYNPRLITERTLEDLMRTIQKFGFLVPVVLNKCTNRIVGGHQRLKAAERLGMTDLPVKVIDLDEVQEKALNLALNKIEGNWDYELLGDALAEVSSADLLSFSGFNEADLVEIMAEQQTEYQETFEGFAVRLGNKGTQSYLTFQSPEVKFSCSKAEYEALVSRIYGKVGVDDIKAAIEFFRMIGLDPED